jgi:hypothetical protein
MIKHKLVVVWVIIFFTAIGIDVYFGMINAEEEATIVLYFSALILFLGFPICIIDSKSRSKVKMKQQESLLQTRLMEKEKELEMLEYEKNLELKEKELEIRAKKLALQEKELEIGELLKARETLTEDDISLLKEKHHCLVHRGDIKGYSYICYSCGAFYCAACVEAVKEIENACWSCQSPIDSSMPALTEGREKSDTKEEIDIHKVKGVLYCPSCGVLVKEDSTFCGTCGRPISK